MNSAPSTFRFHVTIVLYNSARYIRECLAAVLAQSLPPCKITVLDNASADGGDDLVANEFPEVHLIRSDCNYGFAGGHNRAAASFTGYDALLLLNPDAVLKADALERLAASLATHPRVGVLGAKALEADGRTIQHVGIRIKGNALTGPVGEGEPDTGQYRGLLPSPSVLGAAMAIRKETWNALGGLDEDFWPGYFEETDFCCRARRAGWQVAVNCDAEYLHLHGTEDRVRDQAFLQMYFTNRARYMKKNYRLWEWAFRYLPAEIRWLTYWGSKGYRRLAVRSLWQVLTGTPRQANAREESMLNVVLYAPRIPQNAGQVARACHAMGCRLHLVRPLGFRIDAAALKRAAVGYLADVDYAVHADGDALWNAIGPDRQPWLVTKFGRQPYTRVDYCDGDWLIFGSETEGLPRPWLELHADRTVAIPMLNPQVRCLNLATSVAVVMFEALRQIGLPHEG